MYKLDFLKEVNSVSNLDTENEKDNFYSKTKIKNDDDIYYFYSEINKKNKQITELKSIISHLKNNEENLFHEVKSLKNLIPNYSDKNKNKKEEQKIIEREEILLQIIKKLQNENIKLKMKINKNEEVKMNFYNRINDKLLKAERDIQLLSCENKNNNNIILAIQNFLFNINDKIKTKSQKLIFDLSLIDNKTFIHNLQILELNIINKLKQLNIIGNMCLNNSRNYKNNLYDIYDNNYNSYNNKHYTINVNNENKIENIRKNLKDKYKMKTYNNLNIQNQQLEKKLSYKFFYNNFLDEENKKQKDRKHLKTYNLRNNSFKEISGNGDICFENSTDKKDIDKLESSKKSE